MMSGVIASSVTGTDIGLGKGSCLNWSGCWPVLHRTGEKLRRNWANEVRKIYEQNSIALTSKQPPAK